MLQADLGSDFGSETELGSDDPVCPQPGLEPAEVCQHLLGQSDQVGLTQVDSVKSAVQTLSQTAREFDLEDNDAYNANLAQAARTISSFLQVVNHSISTEEQYGVIPTWMKVELVECLDMICERVRTRLYTLIITPSDHTFCPGWLNLYLLTL